MAGEHVHLSGTLHRSLERHLRRLGIDPERGPSTPEQWAAFLDRVNGSFEAFDRERYVVQRSMEVSSREMESLHEAVRRDKERLSAVVEALPEAVVWLDDQLAVEDGNIQSVGLLGRRNAGRRIADLLELLTAQKVPMALPTSVEGLGGGLEEPDGWVSLPDGRRIPAAWTLVPVEGDHGEGALLVVSDLTERKQREQALRAAELDAEVSRRSRASRAASWPTCPTSCGLRSTRSSGTRSSSWRSTRPPTISSASIGRAATSWR